MRTSLVVCCCVFALHCVPGMLGLPVRRAGRYKAAPASEKFTDPKRRGKGPHAQDFMNEASSPTNSSNAWNRPRCGVPDFPTQKEAHLRARHRQRRFVLHGGRFDKTDLTYKINKFPWQMGEDKVRRIFREAVKIWSDVTPLTFTEVRSGTADIQIDFTRYYHGDSLPFDGLGGILAHAFFPKTHKQGEIHFDYDESWTLGNYMGTDLLQVAAHEFGHVLGLQHSHKPKTIMYEYYSFSYPLKLSEDDKQGIQYLYGAKPQVMAPPPTTPPPPPPPPPAPDHIETNEIPPNVCETDFDAASMIRGELFFFKAGYVWRIRDPAGSKHLESGYPALASRHWKGIPAKIDAAFEDKLGNIWFFKGDHFWVFDAETRIRGPEPIRTLGLSISRIQAALRWGHDSNYNTYFFKSGSYWRFSPHEDRVETVHPRRMQDWSGIPDDVDAAFRDIHGYAHFIRGRLYWKFDPVAMTSLEGYPRYVGVDFFNCGRV
ncbi:stromelysin-3 isoform X1 [Austrofundulus limnaeus]|uniref:Stromelysin-3 isoform X1 n=2 Tax=Austrofundulus limnaeus TaxID=52670 RepID=A0A2I4BQP9_AUSLI|nr:PREDICTED: stromelysin-3 isoform X1 [Austrofundulus limnaeus]